MVNMQKHNILSESKDKTAARSKELYIKEHHTAMPKSRQKKEEKELRKAAVCAEKNLYNVWNKEKDNTPDDFKRPVLGRWFGGVDFDKNGKIKT
jgi:hypothetical protein